MSEPVDLMAALKASIDEARERVATAHERVPCPRCGAAVGEPCVRLRPGDVRPPSAPALRYSHADRLRADGIALR